MKNMRVWWWSLIVVASLALWGTAATVFGQEAQGHERDLVARLDRLEHAVHQLAERAEHAGPAAMAQRMMPPQMQQHQQPVPPMQMHAPMPQQCAPGMGPQSARKCPLRGGCGRHLLMLLIPVILIINFLLAVWVFSDIRKRGEGHGIFIILALIAGIPGAILYALVRLGDRVCQRTP